MGCLRQADTADLSLHTACVRACVHACVCVCIRVQRARDLTFFAHARTCAGVRAACMRARVVRGVRVRARACVRVCACACPEWRPSV
jgi:hypothetical protein